MNTLALSLIPIAAMTVLLACGRTDAAGDSPAQRGRAHVEQTCSACHVGAALDTVVRRRDAMAADALEQFLAKHHAADPALRADVIAYLRERLRAAPSGS